MHTSIIIFALVSLLTLLLLANVCIYRANADVLESVRTRPSEFSLDATRSGRKRKSRSRASLDTMREGEGDGD